jgi:hypothetical protein
LELSYDAKEVMFAWTERKGKNWSPESCFHIFKMNVDGTNLVQLTDGSWNDFDPCYLPNGRICFISERIGGFGRCHGRPVPTYTLHTMRADGSDIMPISWHDTNEWHPSVDNDGMIIYTRWDYVDRDSDVAHHIWHTFPDGRNPRSYHGNYPENRNSRPWMELANRSIPDSKRYVAVAAPHHGQNYGSIILIDLREEDDRSCSQLKRVTPEVKFPEAERGRQAYGQPWALSENYFLCVYDPDSRNHGLCLLDGFGNKIMIDSCGIMPCLDPIPLRPRKMPPIIPSQTKQAVEDRKNGKMSPVGIVTVMNIYESEFPFPEGTEVTHLRIVNIFSKATIKSNNPNIGHAAQSLCRGVLGTVPVEKDGSAHFYMPAGTDVYFQALDKNRVVVQTMRSGTYVHPGETLNCLGCHEHKSKPLVQINRKVPLALQRKPSKITREVEGSYPLSFPRLVQPVLDKKCLPCHEKKKEDKTVKKKPPSLRGDKFGKHGWSEAFAALNRYAWGKSGGNGAIRRNGRSYSLPYKDCSSAARLYQMLKKGHNDVKLTDIEMRRIMLWLDCNSNFYGAYKETEKQQKGEVVKPEFGLPPWIAFDQLVR